jgi:hypothetical protein
VLQRLNLLHRWRARAAVIVVVYNLWHVGQPLARLAWERRQRPPVEGPRVSYVVIESVEQLLHLLRRAGRPAQQPIA